MRADTNKPGVFMFRGGIVEKYRTLAEGMQFYDPVEVYCNLHKHLFSVRSKKHKKVVAHTNHVTLKNAVFHVSEAGRQRVLRERTKNVHATIRGELVSAYPMEVESAMPKVKRMKMREAYYNPYMTETFIDRKTGRKLYKAYMVVLVGGKVFYMEEGTS
jgi:hypothetical protein